MIMDVCNLREKDDIWCFLFLGYVFIFVSLLREGLWFFEFVVYSRFIS